METGIAGGREATSVKVVRVLVVVAALVGGLAPIPALAHGFRGGAAVVVAGRSAAPSMRSFPTFVQRIPPPRKSVFPEPVDPWFFWPPFNAPRAHVFDGRRGFGGGFASSYVGTPSVIVTTPYVGDAYGYGTSLTAYAPSPFATDPVPAAFPTPTLIDYSTGWYQLRGDGVTSAYTWVWIPRPPAVPAPPTEPPPLARAPEPSPPPAVGPSPRAELSPAYHWTDERGVTTWTNRLERVPKRFREQAATSSQPE